jgi:hypothetical protein
MKLSISKTKDAFFYFHIIPALQSHFFPHSLNLGIINSLFFINEDFINDFFTFNSYFNCYQL